MSHSFRMILVLAVMLIPAGLATGARVSKRFDFGPGKAAEGYVQVLPGTRYSDKQGYGFEPGSEVVGIDRGGSALEGDFCTSDRPFSFSVAVPEGNYAVSMVFGDPQGLSASTVKAELRRLMLENVTTAMGRLEDRTIVVNVRTPKLLGGGEVRLK
ncbi:MAG TPA: hypothetical protein VFT74_22165, partial [Isosphaeraceae bacterium]|nr:hypothetical protein [Isosphaeraceae bacterium]